MVRGWMHRHQCPLSRLMKWWLRIVYLESRWEFWAQRSGGVTVRVPVYHFEKLSPTGFISFRVSGWFPQEAPFTSIVKHTRRFLSFPKLPPMEWTLKHVDCNFGHGPESLLRLHARKVEMLNFSFYGCRSLFGVCHNCNTNEIAVDFGFFKIGHLISWVNTIVPSQPW